jgi:hypothetical protein
LSALEPGQDILEQIAGQGFVDGGHFHFCFWLLLFGLLGCSERLGKIQKLSFSGSLLNSETRLTFKCFSLLHKRKHPDPTTDREPLQKKIEFSRSSSGAAAKTGLKQDGFV